MDTISSPNMNLPVPIVSEAPGPAWATDVNNCLTLIDQHDHSPGFGVQVTPAGININSDLTFNDNDAISLRSTRFQSQSAVISDVLDLNCCFAVLGDLYFNDGSGNHVRITQSGAVSGTPGSIANLVSPATASYVSATQTFVWQQAANQAANMDFASVIFRNTTASSKGLTLNPPSAMGTDYSLILPSLPGSTLLMTLDASGNMGTGQASTSQIANLAVTTAKIANQAVGTTQIANAAVTQTQMASNSVGTAQIIAHAVTATQIAFNTITGAEMASNNSLPGNSVQENGKNLVVSNTNAGNSLAIIRGGVASGGGGPVFGEGFTSSSPTPAYTVSYNLPFADVAIPVITAINPGTLLPVIPIITSLSNSGFQVVMYDSAISAGIASAFSFIVIGQRA